MNYRVLAPEVVQTSMMDCGPAALKSLLGGCGIRVSYGRLREACQTSVDGTSIDRLEDVAIQLGLDVEQVLLPVDHVLLAQAQNVPAIAVIVLPDGLTHFVVVWGRLGPFVQIMDPGTGRRWPSDQRFLGELYQHTHVVDPAEWRAWAGSDEFCVPLHQRLRGLSGGQPVPEQLIAEALADDGWYSLAALDAAVRMAAAIVDAGGLRAGDEGLAVLEQLFRHARQEATIEASPIPDIYWLVQPHVSADGEEQLLYRGAVLLRVIGPRADDLADDEIETAAPLPPELLAALNEPPPRPMRAIWQLLRADGLFTIALIVLAIGLSSAGTIIQALLLRALVDLGQRLSLTERGVEAGAALLTFLVI